MATVLLSIYAVGALTTLVWLACRVPDEDHLGTALFTLVWPLSWCLVGVFAVRHKLNA